LIARRLDLHGGPGAGDAEREANIAVPVQYRRCDGDIPVEIGSGDRRVVFSFELPHCIFPEFADIGLAAEDLTPFLFDQVCRQVHRQSGRVDLACGRRQHRDQPGAKFKRAALISVLLEQADRTVVGPCGGGRTSPRHVAQIGDLAADNLKPSICCMALTPRESAAGIDSTKAVRMYAEASLAGLGSAACHTLLSETGARAQIADRYGHRDRTRSANAQDSTHHRDHLRRITSEQA
jgi:hypothetical protein